MRWSSRGLKLKMDRTLVLLTILMSSLQYCNGSRRVAQRRKDSTPSVFVPGPSTENLQALAQAMGAAGFEAYTEGKALVKRLIPADSQPDLDVVEHQGIIGKAGVDFPAFPNIPNTGFNCKNVPTGYYADLETDCQVFHICDTSRKISFLCPNGTIFSQSHLICDWWFKVDCASAPTLYESSAEYYSNEQKKSQRITQSVTKTPDLQHLGDINVKAESRRASVNVASTTEKLLRHRQRLQSEIPFNTVKTTSRSYQAILPETNHNPTQRTQSTTVFEKRRRNLVQLIANNFGNLPTRTTLPALEISTRKTTPANYIREMQVVAETASFAQNQNRQFLQEYNKNYRPYPVYTPNLTSGAEKTKPNPTLTTLYDIRNKYLPLSDEETTTKRVTVVPYSSSYTTVNDKLEPYTRPGVSLLKDFLEKEKNKTVNIPSKSSEISEDKAKSDQGEEEGNKDRKLTIESKTGKFESVTKIPDVTRDDNDFIETLSDESNLYASTNNIPITTEPTLQERRERLMRKLNIESFGPTEPTFTATLTEKYYGNLPNRPGLIVPTSLTPKTLHSLAIYYATGLDNFATTLPPEETESTTSYEEYENTEDQSLPALFSQQTINKYSNLFGQGTSNTELLEDIKLDPNGTYNELAEDLTTQMSQGPLAASPQIRELAQVFTHALSAYLQDPVQFRKVLSDIRPTPPSFGDMLTSDELLYNTEPTTTVNEDDHEILGFSDDHKVRTPVSSSREGKAINIETNYSNINYSTTTPTPRTTESTTTTSTTTTPRSPYRCCGRISASYTTSSVPYMISSTQIPFTNTIAVQLNNLSNKFSENLVSTTENSYGNQHYGGFQNNVNSLKDSQYGKDIISETYKPLSDYTEISNVPSAWGLDATLAPVTKVNIFESKKIKSSTVPAITTHFTETDSIELENEEELQRAHSQSFIAPQSNSLRQGKQINLEDSKGNIKKPSENLEAPSKSTSETTSVQTTTDLPTTTIKDQTESLTTLSQPSIGIFTSPDVDKTTYQFPTTFDNWQSTIVVDPITLNDGLSSTGSEQDVSDVVQQTNSWSLTTAASPTTDYFEGNEHTVTTVTGESTTLSNKSNEKFGRLLRDSTTESAQDLTTDTVVEKAKEIMGGMNSTTAEKLMNVMKKTKSKTVKRLILLLIQTCEDDHNSTAEASKKALLEALMAVSQKDMEEVAKEQTATELPSSTAEDEYIQTTLYNRRMDRTLERQDVNLRRGKSLNLKASVINSLSQPATTETAKTEETEPSTTVSPTTTLSSLKGVKKIVTKTPHFDQTTKSPHVDLPLAQARIGTHDTDLKTPSDTRALELLRSLYTIAARWG